MNLDKVDGRNSKSIVTSVGGYVRNAGWESCYNAYGVWDCFAAFMSLLNLELKSIATGVGMRGDGLGSCIRIGCGIGLELECV